MIKAVFFDIDGTLIDHQVGKVPMDTRAAIERLKENGIKVFIASGRHICEIKELDLKDISFDGYVLLNGQICLDGNEKLIFSQPIASSDQTKIVTLFKEKQGPLVLVEKDSLYINMVNEYVEIAHRAISTPVPPIKDYDGKEIYLTIPYGNDEYIQAVENTLDTCKAVKWNQYAADVIPLVGSKVAGIKEILKFYQLEQSEIMAFGDGDNDVEMLDFAAVGVAMGNASDEVKSHSDVVTSAVGQMGITLVLQEYGLI